MPCVGGIATVIGMALSPQPTNVPACPLSSSAIKTILTSCSPAVDVGRTDGGCVAAGSRGVDDGIMSVAVGLICSVGKAVAVFVGLCTVIVAIRVAGGVAVGSILISNWPHAVSSRKVRNTRSLYAFT